eukprot:gene5441-971_t
MLAVFILALNTVARILADQTCATAAEGQAAVISCPQGQVITGFTTAIFGTFQPSSGCAVGLQPSPLCPTTVKAQADLLCAGRQSCSLACSCDANQTPPCSCELHGAAAASVAGPLAVPAWPCNGIEKSLGLIASCAAAVRPPALPVAVLPASSSNLLLEYMPTPVLGLDNLQPQFAWTPPVVGGLAQSAYRVNVTGSGAEIWSSGKVVSPSPTLAVANGSLALVSDSLYAWTVETWPGPTVSQAAHFSTGLLNQADWNGASWISAGACSEVENWTRGAHWLPIASCKGGLLRKDFAVTGQPTRVSLFVSGCHYYEIFLDGARVGNDAGITNSWTRFNRFRSYATMDIDPDLLGPGEHTFGLHVGQGFCGEPEESPTLNATRAVLLKVVLHCASDVILQTVGTDDTWQLGHSPLVWESAYYGEVYLAKLEQPGWSTTAFRPTAPWPPTTVVKYSPAPLMSSQLQPPIQAVHYLQPVSIERVLRPDFTRYSGPESLALPARWTYDFGQEFSGHVKLQLPAGVPPGTNFTLSFAEVLSHPPLPVVTQGKSGPNISHYDGSTYMGNLFWSNPVDVFQAFGEGEQMYEPRFTYHAFRYVELAVDPPLPASLEGSLNISSVVGINMRTAAREQAELHIANPLLAKLSSNSWWTESSGLIGIPSGAGARGERAGWSGDAAAASESECFDFDTAAFFSQYLAQIAQTSCQSDGTIGDCVPNTDPRRDTAAVQLDPNTCSGLTSDPTWSTFYVTITHNVWKYYGATNVVRKHYAQLKQYMTTLETRKNATGLGKMFCRYGDWNPVTKTPCQITAALSFIHDVRRMSDLAGAIGNSADATMWTSKDSALTSEFHAPCVVSKGGQACAGHYGGFWDSKTSTYLSGSQMSVAAALWLGNMPEGRKAPLLAALAAEITRQGVTVGFVGVQYLFEALVWANRTDVALTGLLRTAFPGYGHEIYNTYEPATTLWESWTGDTMPQWLAESSRNHHYQTSINTFLRKYVAGLSMPRHASGWSFVSVRPEAALLPPEMAEEIPSAAVSIESHRGVVATSWERRQRDCESRSTNGAPLLCVEFEINATVPSTSTGIVDLRQEGSFVVHTVVGGTFSFVAR